MCGICGQYNFGNPAPVRCRAIEAMTKTLIHRGPDEEGYFVAGALGFGIRRLSIIDIADGRQPMSDREETVWVIFNGEIYNFLELRRELEQLGHVFHTKSDTEVIVHGYKQWGDEVLSRLNGMFALAIWDVRQKRLVLARDPFGIKLLYYRIDGNSLYFGSELRAIRATMPDKPEIDPTSLHHFLRYRFTPSPHTILKGVRKLAAGTKLTVQTGSYQITRWYAFKPVPFRPPKSLGEAAEELLALYKQAVRRQLVSDVPIGLLLSGGLDSGMLLALMNLNGSYWPTYTVGYGSAFIGDELGDATETARILESNHTSVTITRSIFEETLPKIVATLEEPIASSSIVPMYFVCERASQDVKVAMVGQGPDELFGGYRRHLGVRYGALWARLPSWTRSVVSSTVAALPRNETLKRGVYSLSVPNRVSKYQRVLSILAGDQVEALFQDGVLAPNSGDTILDSWAELAPLMSGTDDLGGLQFLELQSTLPDEILMYTDKLSMAHGLELRVPFLDKEIVEYVERLPASLKVRNCSQKWLHRQVCRPYLPHSLLKRRKRGFAANVVDDWFRDPIDNKMANTLLDRESKIYQYLRASSVRELLDLHVSARQDNHKILFSLVLFEEWLRAHEQPVLGLP